MPNQRSPDQTLIAFACNQELLEKIEEARKLATVNLDRSTFIRKSIADELRALGYEVPDALVQAPDRAGKGGRKPIVRYPSSPASQAVQLNESSSTIHPAAAKFVKKRVDAIRARRSKNNQP